MLPVIILEELLTFRNLLTAARVANAASTVAEMVDDAKEQERFTDEVNQNIDADDEAYFFFFIRATFAKVATYCNEGNPSVETLDAITTSALDSDIYINAPSDPDTLIDAFLSAWITAARINGSLNLECLAKAAAGFRTSGIPANTMSSWLDVNKPAFKKIAEKASSHVDLPPELLTTILDQFGPALKTGPAAQLTAELTGKQLMMSELFIMRLYTNLLTDDGLTNSIGARKKGRLIISTAFLPFASSTETYTRPTFHETVVTRLDENDLVDRIRREQGRSVKGGQKPNVNTAVDKRVLDIMERIYGTKKQNRKQKESKGSKHKSGSGSKAEKYSSKGGTFKDAKGGAALEALQQDMVQKEKKKNKS